MSLTESVWMRAQKKESWIKVTLGPGETGMNSCLIPFSHWRKRGQELTESHIACMGLCWALIAYEQTWDLWLEVWVNQGCKFALSPPTVQWANGHSDSSKPGVTDSKSACETWTHAWSDKFVSKISQWIIQWSPEPDWRKCFYRNQKSTSRGILYLWFYI